MKKLLSEQNWSVLILLMLLTVVLSAPIYAYRINNPVDSDYGSHIRFTIEFLKTRSLEPATLSHPLLQFILAFMYWITRSRLSLENALILLQVLVQVVTVLILYFWFGKSQRKNWDWIRAAAAFTLTFIAPILLLAVFDQKFYFGYIGLANYHNPTVHMLKPLALISTIFAIDIVNGKKSGWWAVLFSALIMMISTWLKPNFALVILPALGLACLLRLLQKRQIDWKMVIWGFAVPGVVNLFFQWLIAYVYGDPGEGIIIAPFQVEKAFSDWIFLKFILSSLFPLIVLYIARKELLQNSSLLVGWSAFLMGVIQNYFLAEGGERLLHGNFRWSGQIGLFILFAITVNWLLKNKATLREKVAAYSAYAAHFAGGVAYYIYCLVSTHYG